MPRARTGTGATIRPQQHLWRSLPLETIFAIKHLHTGGVPVEHIGDVVGVHGRSVSEVLKTFDTLWRGPIQIASRVRCNGCGALLTEIPCRLCGRDRQSYRVTKRGNSDVDV